MALTTEDSQHEYDQGDAAFVMDQAALEPPAVRLDDDQLDGSDDAFGLESLDTETQRLAAEPSRRELLADLNDQGAVIGRAERARLRDLRLLHAKRVWRDDDCRDMAQRFSLSTGIGSYRARKMVDCAIAIESLPLISEALCSGVLSLDKVVELTRFATPDTERKLITWAKRVSPVTIRNRADEACRKDPQETKDDRNDRFFQCQPDVAKNRMWLSGCLPMDTGLEFTAPIEALAKSLAEAPAEERDGYEHNPIAQRRADALVQLVTQGAGADSTSKAVTTEVFVHTKLDASGFGNGVIATGVTGSGAVLGPEVMERLTCDCRLRFVLTDASGNPLGIGEASQAVPYWLKQAVLKAYDWSCVFPNCDCRLGLEAHHIVHWGYGGPTDFDNLVPLCARHHALVHDHDWSIFKGDAGTIAWYRPDGRRYEPGPDPPFELASKTTTGSINEASLRSSLSMKRICE